MVTPRSKHYIFHVYKEKFYGLHSCIVMINIQNTHAAMWWSTYINKDMVYSIGFMTCYE